MQLNITPYTPQNRYNHFYSMPQRNVTFGAAKDINLKYILKNRSHLLPTRICERVTEILENCDSKELPTLKDVHEKAYAALMEAKTLEQAKTSYPEFSDVIDFKTVANKYPRSAKAIARQMTLDEFSLDCLKKIWSGMSQEDITKAYGFSCRAVLAKLCKALNIPKPEGNYLVLLKTSYEEGNRKVAEITLQHLDICRKNLSLANIANKTPKARAKQAASMRRFYDENPAKREEVSLISKETWRRCPEIKEAMVTFMETQPSYIQVASLRQMHGERISDIDRRLVRTFYKRFWDEFPEFKEKYAQARKDAADAILRKND